MKLSKEERRKQMAAMAIPAKPKDSWKTRSELQRDNADWVTDAIVIAHKIMDALEDQGLKQKDLAARLNITPQAVNKIVKGRQNLTLGTIRRIEQALDISLISLRSNKNAVATTSIIASNNVPKYNHSTVGYSMSVKTIERNNNDAKIVPFDQAA